MRQAEERVGEIDISAELREMSLFGMVVAHISLQYRAALVTMKT
jgi:hypothetical protein